MTETPKPPSCEWDKQLFYCPVQGHRVTGTDCDTYFRTGHKCPPGTCDLRARMMAETASAEPAPVIPDSQLAQPEPPAPAGEKVCRGCEISLPLAEFSRHGRTADGYAHTCKLCMGARISLGSRQKKPAGTRAPAPPPPGKTRPPAPAATTELRLDFSAHPDLLADLKKTADDNFRTPHGQVLFFINEMIGGRDAAQT